MSFFCDGVVVVGDYSACHEDQSFCNLVKVYEWGVDTLMHVVFLRMNSDLLSLIVFADVL